MNLFIELARILKERKIKKRMKENEEFDDALDAIREIYVKRNS